MNRNAENNEILPCLAGLTYYSKHAANKNSRTSSHKQQQQQWDQELQTITKKTQE